MKKRALVISGGGAKGAFGCGVSEGLCMLKDYEYSLLVGTSTGALQMGLVGLKEFEKLKVSYLNVNQKSIFNYNPFTKKGEVSFWKAIPRFILGKDSFGESKNLKKLIDKFFTKEDYDELIKREIEISAVVTSLTDKKVYSQSNNVYGHDDMKDWIWASANSPMFMTFMKKFGHKWTDGGVKEHIPIQTAIDAGYTDIDVIVHRPKTFEEDKRWTGKGIIKNLFRILQIVSEDVSENDIEVSQLKALDEDVNLNIYYTPYNLTDKSLMFDKKIMREWWDLGYNLIKDDLCEKTELTLKKTK